MLVSNSLYYLQTISSITNHIDNFGNIFLTSVVVGSLYHHTHHRLCTGFTHQNATSIAQSLSYYISIFDYGRFEFGFSASIEVTFYNFKHFTKHNRYCKRQTHSKPAIKVNRKFSHYNIAIFNYKLMC